MSPLLVVTELISEIDTQLAVGREMHSEMLIGIIDGRCDAAALKEVIAVETKNGMLARKRPSQTHVKTLTTAEVIDGLNGSCLHLSCEVKGDIRLLAQCECIVK